jgi:hypothetical protein
MRIHGDDHRLPTLAEYRDLAERTLRNAGSDRLRATAAGSNRLMATAEELVTHDDRRKTGNEFHDLLSEILRLVHEAGGEDFSLNEYPRGSGTRCGTGRANQEKGAVGRGGKNELGKCG